ncbi:MAG: c-type cytochrome [Acidobacteria bacterium]|nr:c-type cytochrome [Acidobacteriota bacterium]
MRRIVWVAALAAFASLSARAATQQPAAGGMYPDKPWAFPAAIEKPFPEDPAPKSLPGSTRTYTPAQIDNLMSPPDWFPDRHPAPPQVVAKGHGGVMACGACHLMSGLGHPESSGLAGLTLPYIVQQMLDFKSGARKDVTGKRMNGIASEMTDLEIQEAAAYFASLPVPPFQKVVESAMVPKTFLGNGRMRFVDPAGGMEPIGARIISVPQEVDRVRLRDPYVGFTSYVPMGSLARGKTLVDTGGGKTMNCGLCHGLDLKGQASIPRLAGMHPVYLARQLYWFKDGTRSGPDAPLMKPWAASLNDDDIIAIAAYLASVE